MPAATTSTVDLISERELQHLREIARLHDEAFRRYQECRGSSWKSSEGAITVCLGDFWDRDPDEPTRPGVAVEVYSYALGPGRNHYFSSTFEALTEVRRWHAAAMAHKCDGGC